MERNSAILTDLSELTTFEVQLASELTSIGSHIQELQDMQPPNSDYFVNAWSFLYTSLWERQQNVRAEIRELMKESVKLQA